LPKAKNKLVDDAFVLYRQGMKLKDIAEQLDIPEGTIRRWKHTYEWDNERSEKITNVRKRRKRTVQVKNESVESEVKQIIENPDLTDKQRLFCVYYSRCFNATKAYQKAYQCSYETAVVAGPRMLGNVRVKEEIFHLKQERLNREFLSEADIFQKYMDIAFADITDYVEFGIEEEPVMSMYGPVKIKDPDTGEEKQLTQIVNTVRFKESTGIDGTILTEIKHGRNGSSIKLADRMKALEWLSKHMDLGTEEQRVRIEQIKIHTENVRQKLQTNVEETADDGFLEALNTSAAEDWNDEETGI
jgi:phage terminase small subunit